MKFVSYQTIYAHKLLRALSPRGELHVRDYTAILHHSKVVIVGIDEHLRKVEELWDQFLQGLSTDTRINSRSQTYSATSKKQSTS